MQKRVVLQNFFKGIACLVYEIPRITWLNSATYAEKLLHSGRRLVLSEAQSLPLVGAESRAGGDYLQERSASTIPHACSSCIPQIDCRFLLVEDRQIAIRKSDAKGCAGILSHEFALHIMPLLANVMQRGPFFSSMPSIAGFLEVK